MTSSSKQLKNLVVDPWDPITMRPNSVLCIIGRRGSGKSSIVFSLLYYMRKMFDVVFAFCPTVDVARKFQKILPDCFVWNETQSEESLDTTLRTFTEILNQGKTRRGLIVGDDCAFDGKFFKSIPVRELAYNGRNCNLSWMITCQGNVDLPPQIRGQIDYVLLARENINTTIESLYKRYAGIFDSQEHFKRVLKRVTQNYTALVIDQTKTTSDISKCVFFFRSKIFDQLPPFRISKDCFFEMDKIFNRANRPKEDMSKSKKIFIKEETLTDFTKI